MILHKNHPYEVIVTMSPPPNGILVYGIRNTVTGVVEAYIAQLAKAKFFCDLYAKELRDGMYDEVKATRDSLESLKNGEEPTSSGGFGGSGGLN